LSSIHASHALDVVLVIDFWVPLGGGGVESMLSQYGQEKSDHLLINK
jgi:hypothetical protein